MKYKAVFVLGTDQLAAYCAREIKQRQCDVRVMDTGNKPGGMLSTACRNIGIAYNYMDRQERESAILDVPSPTLLVSVVNPWLIPRRIFEKKGLVAVNLHHSLLPHHPGRNAESWAVYEGDDHAGVSWHFISEKVDAGNIIIQKSVAIDDKITALGLFKIQNELAKSAFSEICQSLLEGTLSGRPQSCYAYKIHYSREKPNDGYLDPMWDAAKTSRFLRAMDYGLLKVMGDPKITIGADTYSWSRYSIVENKAMAAQGIRVDGQTITLYKEETSFILNNIKKVN